MTALGSTEQSCTLSSTEQAPNCLSTTNTHQREQAPMQHSFTPHLTVNEPFQPSSNKTCSEQQPTETGQPCSKRPKEQERSGVAPPCSIPTSQLAWQEPTTAPNPNITRLMALMQQQQRTFPDPTGPVSNTGAPSSVTVPSTDRPGRQGSPQLGSILQVQLKSLIDVIQHQRSQAAELNSLKQVCAQLRTDNEGLRQQQATTWLLLQGVIQRFGINPSTQQP
eukprot:m.128022 g.128022  ORF g.128022 m.128022 type:complete len:222 (-) comp15814_c0_seq2:2502-3167(-)